MFYILPEKNISHISDFNEQTQIRYCMYLSHLSDSENVYRTENLLFLNHMPWISIIVELTEDVGVCWITVDYLPGNYTSHTALWSLILTDDVDQQTEVSQTFASCPDVELMLSYTGLCSVTNQSSTSIFMLST